MKRVRIYKENEWRNDDHGKKDARNWRLQVWL